MSYRVNHLDVWAVLFTSVACTLLCKLDNGIIENKTILRAQPTQFFLLKSCKISRFWPKSINLGWIFLKMTQNICKYHWISSRFLWKFRVISASRKKKKSRLINPTWEVCPLAKHFFLFCFVTLWENYVLSVIWYQKFEKKYKKYIDQGHLE